MKLTIPTIGVLVTIVALASVGGIYALTFESGFASFAGSNSIASGPMLVGNVKVIQFDENGDILAYRHGSNHITAKGMAVIIGQTFTGINSTFIAPGNATGRVSHMQIGHSGDPLVYSDHLAWNNTDIILPIGNACKRVAFLSISNTSAHQADSSCAPRSACAARINVTAIADFQGADCGGAGTIDEAGIYTDGNPQGGLMFARNTFGSVVLGGMDTLQLQWEFSFKDALP